MWKDCEKQRITINFKLIRLLLVLLLVLYSAFTLLVYSRGIGSLGMQPRQRPRSRVSPTLPLSVRVPLSRHPNVFKDDTDTMIYMKYPGIQIKETDITVIIKTMDRPRCVKQLITEIATQHSNLSILVADDGELPSWHEEKDGMPNVKYFRMPYDSGLSAGRNLALSQVQTPYVLLLDDDFLWDPTVLRRFTYVMENHPYLDVVGGRAGLHFAGFMRSYNSTLFLVPGKHGVLEGTDNLHTNKSNPGKPCEVVDFVPNFFLARTDTLMSLMWQNSLKIGEHEEFFLRFNKGDYKAAFCPDITVLNQQTKCAEVQISAKDVERKRQINRGRARMFIKKGLKLHKLNKLAYCLGPGFVAQTWNRLYDFPNIDCYEVPLPEDCPVGWMGEKCESCMPGYFGLDCKPCGCKHGTCVERQHTGIVDCICDIGWVGDKCQEQASFSDDLIGDPTFSSLAVEDSGKWFPYKDGCFSFATEGIWLVNDGQMACGAGYKLELNQTEGGLILVTGQSMSVGVKNLENPSMYSVYIDITFMDDTMQYGHFVPFSQGTHGLETKELVLAPPKPVKLMLIYVLLRNSYGSVYFQNVTVRAQVPNTIPINNGNSNNNNKHKM